MLTYCLKCKRNRENVNSEMLKTKCHYQNVLYVVIKI